MSTKYKMKKAKMGEGKKAGAKMALVTLLTIIVAGIVALSTCAYVYHWTWDMVKYWLNPFSEGNNWTWLIYLGLLLLLLVIIWLIHRVRIEKMIDEGK